MSPDASVVTALAPSSSPPPPVATQATAPSDAATRTTKASTEAAFGLRQNGWLVNCDVPNVAVPANAPQTIHAPSVVAATPLAYARSLLANWSCQRTLPVAS